MATERDLSLGTVFTADVKDLARGVGQVRQMITRLYGDMSRGAARARRPVTELEKAQSLLRNRLQEMRGVNESYSKALGKSVQALRGNASAIRDQVKHFDALRKTVNAHARIMNNAGRSGTAFAQSANYAALSAGVLQKRLKMTERGFVRVDTAAKKAAASQTWIGKQIASVAGAYQRLGAAFKVTAAYAVAARAIFGVTDALTAGVREIVEYDQALKNLQAITGATSGELAAMGDKIRDVARTTKFSVTEVAEGMVLLGQAGFDAGEAIDAMQASADLATGTLTDLQTTVDLLTTAIRAFQLDSSESAKVADIFANAINKSKLTVDKLRVAFNYIGPAAQAAGAELEEVAAAMMTLANSGLRASTIGTGLRQVFSRIVAPTAKLQEAFDKYNISMDDLNIQSQGFTGVIRNLSEVFIDAETGVTDSRKAFELFGLRGANAIISLVKAVQSGSYREMLDKVYEVGTAARMASIQIEGLALKFKNVKDRAGELAIELGEGGLTTIIGIVLDSLKGLLEILREFAESTMGKVISTFVAWTAAVYALTFSVAALGKMLKWLANIIYTKVIASAIAAKSVMPLVILAIGAIVTAYQQWRLSSKRQLEQLQKEQIELKKQVDVLSQYRDRLEEIDKTVQKTGDGHKKYQSEIDRLKGDFKELTDEIDAAKGSFTAIEQVIEGARFEAAEKALEKQVEVIQKLEETLEKERLVGSVSVAWAKLKAWTIKNVLIKALDNYKAKLNEIKEGWKSILDLMSSKYAPGPILLLGHLLGILTDKTEEFFKTLGDESEQVKTHMEITEQEIQNLIGILVDFYKTGVMTIEDIQKKIEGFNLSAEVVKRILEDTMKLIKKHEENVKSAKLLPTLEPAEQFYKKWFDEAAYHQKVGIAKIIKQMKTDIASVQKEIKDSGLGVADAAQLMENIHREALEKILNIIHSGIELEHERKRKIEQILMEENETRQRLLNQQIAYIHSYYNARIAAAKGNTRTIQNLEKRMTEEIAILEERKKAVALDTASRRLELRKEFLDEELAYELEMALRLAERRTDTAIANAKREGAEQKKTKEEINLDIANLERQLAEERLRILTLVTNKLAAVYGIDSKQFRESRQEMYDAQVALNEAIANQKLAQRAAQKKELKMSFGEATDAYREGRLTAEKYFEYVQQARDDDLISETQYQDQKAMLMEGYWASFKRGLIAAKREVQSFSEMFYDIASNLPRMFAENMSDAFKDVMDGSKSFGEAMIDVFTNILDYIAQTIIQLLIMKAIMSMVGGGSGGMFSFLGGGGGGGGGGTFTGPSIGAGVGGGAANDYGLGGFKTWHKGGVPGKDEAPRRRINPLAFLNAERFHDGMLGLKQNEMPVIVDKREGIFTPAQMRALGERSQLSIHVPVTVSGDDGKMLASKLRTNIEEVVMKTLKQEMR